VFVPDAASVYKGVNHSETEFILSGPEVRKQKDSVVAFPIKDCHGRIQCE